jgi:hypothetical protein
MRHPLSVLLISLTIACTSCVLSYSQTKAKDQEKAKEKEARQAEDHLIQEIMKSSKSREEAKEEVRKMKNDPGWPSNQEPNVKTQSSDGRAVFAEPAPGKINLKGDEKEHSGDHGDAPPKPKMPDPCPDFSDKTKCPENAKAASRFKAGKAGNQSPSTKPSSSVPK